MMQSLGLENKTAERGTLRRITQTGNNEHVLAKGYCFFFKEKTINGHQIYSTENFGKNALPVIL
jgi:hypothetical protein